MKCRGKVPVMNQSNGPLARRMMIGMSAVVLLIALGGCVRPYGVPAWGQLVAEAPAQAASFQAPDDGTIYVDGPGRPGEPRHIAYSGLIRRGEVVTVNPEVGVLTVDNKPIAATIQTGHSFYQIWYAPAHNELLGY